VVQTRAMDLTQEWASALAGLLAQASSDASSKSLWSYIQSGREVGWVILMLSVVALGMIIANAIVLRKSYLAPQRVIDDLQRLLSARQVEQAIAYCRAPENDCFLARLLANGLSRAARSTFGVLELKPALEAAGQRELDRIDRLTHGLRLIAEIAPMLGLLGTVFGMVGAFAEIGSAPGAARSTGLAGYMSLALVTTAMGLILAVPATVAYALYKRRSERVAGEVADIAEALVAVLQTSPAARPPVGVAAPNGPAAAPAANVARPGVAPAPVAAPAAPAVSARPQG
jgi:biopolymer transport protein ExbB